jgi:quinol monooxygenase YgiN
MIGRTLARATERVDPSRQRKQSWRPDVSELQGIARFKFHEGKVEEFKRLSAQAMEIVRTEDTGTLQYEIYFNDDQSECIVLERYRDSEALTEHAAHLGDLSEAILATGFVSERRWPTPWSVSSRPTCRCRHRSPGSVFEHRAPRREVKRVEQRVRSCKRNCAQKRKRDASGISDWRIRWRISPQIPLAEPTSALESNGKEGGGATCST